jgi:asparagine synthase (glutamine-hydrolysing)
MPQHRRITDLRRELVAQLEDAVRLRLVSDVPLGAFLSGGVDSSAVVAMMARIGTGTVKTFSIGFSAKQYDETHYARMVAQRYSTEHQELVIEPDAVTVLPRLVWHYGEPFADPSAIPTYYVSEMARQKVTVALSGDGGDECFFGYNRYRAMRLVSRLDRIPQWSRTGLERLLGLAPRSVQRRFKVPRIRGVLQAPKEQPCRRYAFTIVTFTDCDKKHGYSELMRAQRESSALDLLEPYFAEADSLVVGANWADLHTYLPDDLMVKVDVASMAHGLESRSPLLDHVFMEWAAGIPEEIRMARGVTKALFKSAMEPYLPTEVLYRPKKGFSLPVDQWFRSDLKELAYDTLLSRISAERGLFRPEYVRLLLDEHCALACDHHTRLWALLMLELWFQMWIDAPAKTEIFRPAIPSVAGR